MKRLLVAIAAVALLGGCFKVDKAPPKDLPAYASVYPGATGVVSMDMGPMTIVAFQAAASPDDVIGYYRGQASSNGLQETPTNANAAAGGKQLAFKDPTTSRVFMVTARPQGAGSTVSLAYTKAK